jgi:hypothetical protein
MAQEVISQSVTIRAEPAAFGTDFASGDAERRRGTGERENPVRGGRRKEEIKAMALKGEREGGA